MSDVTTEAFEYSSGVAPAGYKCGQCGATGCKLWREYNTFLEHQALYCVNCAGKNQKKDVTDADAEGKITWWFENRPRLSIQHLTLEGHYAFVRGLHVRMPRKMKKQAKKDFLAGFYLGPMTKENMGRCDQIGWLVPAVPTEEGDTYWGYTSVPQPGCDWWRDLPTFPAM